MQVIDYTIQYGIGRGRYVVSYYTGKKHRDGSPFYDIAIFSNRRKMEAFIRKFNR